MLPTVFRLYVLLRMKYSDSESRTTKRQSSTSTIHSIFLQVASPTIKFISYRGRGSPLRLGHDSRKWEKASRVSSSGHVRGLETVSFAWAKSSKIGGPVIAFRRPPLEESWHQLDSRNVKRTHGRPRTRSSDFFRKYLKGRYNDFHPHRASQIHRSTLARDMDERRRCWHPL